jgi:hypothetical protein
MPPDYGEGKQDVAATVEQVLATLGRLWRFRWGLVGLIRRDLFGVGTRL